MKALRFVICYEDDSCLQAANYICNGAKYLVGPPGYYTRIDNRSSFGEKRPSLEELMNKLLEESTRKRAKMEEWVKKL
ncbi:hypothetical protein Tco_1101047 [Tanacetum coccineum]